MALIAHFGILVAGFLPALIVYFIKKDSLWVRKECAKVLNFMIILFTVQFFAFGFFFVGLVLFSSVDDTGTGSSSAFTFFPCFLFPVIIALNLAQLILAIVNGVKVVNNQPTKYWLSIPIFRPKG